MPETRIVVQKHLKNQYAYLCQYQDSLQYVYLNSKRNAPPTCVFAAVKNFNIQ